MVDAVGGTSQFYLHNLLYCIFKRIQDFLYEHPCNRHTICCTFQYNVLGAFVDVPICKCDLIDVNAGA